MTEGRAGVEGIIQSGRPFAHTVNSEFPKLVAHVSQQRSDVQHGNPMLNSDWLLKKQLVNNFHEKVNLSVDLVECRDGWSVNDWSALSRPINELRVREYENALKGNSWVGHLNWLDFYQSVDLLWKVTKDFDTVSQQTFHRGSCWHFWDQSWCVHAVLLQHQTRLSRDGKPIAQTKSCVGRRKTTHQQQMRAYDKKIKKNAKQARQEECEAEIEMEHQKHKQRKEDIRHSAMTRELEALTQPPSQLNNMTAGMPLMAQGIMPTNNGLTSRLEPMIYGAATIQQMAHNPVQRQPSEQYTMTQSVASDLLTGSQTQGISALVASQMHNLNATVAAQACATETPTHPSVTNTYQDESLSMIANWTSDRNSSQTGNNTELLRMLQQGNWPSI